MANNFTYQTIIVLTISFVALMLLFNRPENNSLPLPSRIVEENSGQVPSIDERRTAIHTDAPMIEISYQLISMHWSDPKYSRTQIQNFAIDLAREGNADSEYIVGSVYEHGVGMNPNELLMPLYDANILVPGDAELAKKWYALADTHGSPEAALALGRMYSVYDSPAEQQRLARCCFERAVKRGREDANVNLGRLWEYGLGGAENLPKAMQLYEEAAASKNEDWSTWGIQMVLWLWNEKQVKPSAHFCMGSDNALHFVRRFDRDITAENIGHLYLDPGCSPNPYVTERFRVLPKLRQALMH
jgi:hypothetical protein